MNVEDIREYCISKKAVTEDFPFNDVALVLKVLDKMFALVNIEEDLSINLKCNPEKAILLRNEYEAVKPGFHMNKKHWNTVEIDGTIATSKIYEWIDDSYNLVISKMTKKQRENL